VVSEKRASAHIFENAVGRAELEMKLLRLGDFVERGHWTYAYGSFAVAIAEIVERGAPAMRREAYEGDRTRRRYCAAANPHLLLAVLVRAGLQGISEALIPPPPTEEDLSLASADDLAQRGITRLPTTLADALNELDASDVVRGWLPAGFVDVYLAHKRGEIAFLEGKSEDEIFAAYANAY
jgi:glutamine synthetase